MATQTRTTDNGAMEDPAHAERLRKVPGKVDDRGLDVIRRAISLKQAVWTVLAADTDLLTGEAIVRICEDWLRTESARLSGKGGES